MSAIAKDTVLHDSLVKLFKSNQPSSLQKEAFDLFEKTGFPTTKHEEWKYTNVRPIISKEFEFEAPTSLKKEDIKPFFIENIDAYHMIFINGVFNASLSSLPSSADVTVSNFTDIDKSILEKYFSKAIAFGLDAFVSLNTAMARHGAFIHVKAGKALDKAIVLHYISDAQQKDVMSQPRNLFLMERNAQATIIETFNTIGSHESFTNTISEIVLLKDAHVDYYKIQNESDKAYHVGTTQFYLEEKSFSNSTTITLNGAIIRNNLNIQLNDEYCEAHLNGLYLTSGNTHVDNHTLVDHAKANCYSSELYKGVLNDKSSGVFNGKIYVKQDAQKTNAFQSNKNILLSPDASVNTKPQLEIFADDVKCSHGCTTGQLDEEPLFYMRARGISEENARALLTYAFASDIIEHVKFEPLKAYLNKLIATRLNKGIINELL